jgi:hypothetical protein
MRQGGEDVQLITNARYQKHALTNHNKPEKIEYNSTFLITESNCKWGSND